MLSHAITGPSFFPNQSSLEHVLKQLFPSHQVFKNVRKSAQIEANNNYFLELDFWFPSLRLAFEFQDPHHYISGWVADSPHQFQLRDEKKKEVMTERKETLVIVPCWWDGRAESLAASIKNERPDLLQDFNVADNTKTPIPSAPPTSFFKDNEIPGVGVLMSPSYPSNLQFDPTNWWISEKYDGVRACLAGERLYSRYASLLGISNNFISSLPPRAVMDGELWFGRGYGREAQKISFSRQSDVTSNDSLHSWEFLRFVAFDFPSSLSLSFEKRYATLLLFPLSPWTIISSYERCRSKAHLNRKVYETVRGRGEGVVLRDHLSLYVHGRSTDAIKIKANRDEEGLVVDLCKENPKEILLQLSDGTTFAAKVREEEIKRETKREIKEGDIVTFTYESFSGSAPVAPVVSNVRFEREMIQDELLETQTSKNVRWYWPDETNNNTHPRGYWTKENSSDNDNNSDKNNNNNSNVKIFFDKMAEEKNRDPLSPESWYDISWKEIGDRKGYGLLAHYSSLQQALVDAYPHITFQPTKFSRVSRNHWNDAENRRKFFDMIAHENNFEPLLPESWYSFSSSIHFSSCKGMWNVIERHGFSLETALIELYPEIGLSKYSFQLWRKYNKKYK